MSTKPFRIREIATTYQGAQCATVDLDDVVWVWNLNDGSLVSKFKSRYSLGGRRLALTPDGTLCATAQYDKHGINAYRVSDGSVLWHRDDLQGVQVLSYDPTEECWVACFDKVPCHLLHRGSGKTLATLRGVHRRASSLYDDVLLVEKSRKEPLELRKRGTEKTIGRIRRCAPAVLDACFGPGFVFIAEMTTAQVRQETNGEFVCTGVFDPPGGGPLRCVLTSDGSLLWEYKPGEGKAVDRVCYTRTCRTLQAVLGTEGPERFVLAFDTTAGSILNETVLEGNTCQTEFALGGDILVTSGGEVIDLTGDEPTVRLRLKTPN